MRNFFLLPNIMVQNANALSSQYTIGFPAMTAWLGAVHFLQRKINEISMFEDIKLLSVGVISHDFDLKFYKGSRDYDNSIIGTANPLSRSGDRPSFIEEARCSITVSLLVEYEGLNAVGPDEFKDFLKDIIHSKMKIAGGDVLRFNNIEIVKVETQEDFAKLKRKLMPGYVITERKDLMQNAMSAGKDAIDSLLDYLSVIHECTENGTGEIAWEAKRLTNGWIVPIATGFQGISGLEQAKNQRDPYVPHRFVESIVTLGEFIMPYRLESLDEMLWKYRYDPDQELYICENINQ